MPVRTIERDSGAGSARAERAAAPGFHPVLIGLGLMLMALARLMEIAAATGLSKSTAHGVLDTLDRKSVV